MGMSTTMPDPETDPTVEQVATAVRVVMDDAWVDLGYTAPNTDVYPWLWLWDSCFHVLIWAELGDSDRDRSELRRTLETQDAAGFVPHMGYQLDPEVPVDLWGRRGSSSITQPPMFGHAIAELVRRGIEVEPDLVDRAQDGLRFLLEDRWRDPESGLLTVVHPWETGCDDSPRWDHYCPGEGFDLETWRRHKVDLLAGIERGAAGEPLANPGFAAAPVSFSALTVWNARELASVSGDAALLVAADELADALASTWDESLGTWVDQGPGAATSGRVRTADALLPLLVVDDPTQRGAVVAALADSAAFGGVFGPPGVHPDEPMYDPASYWRGPVWPQIAYLLWKALGRGPAETELGEIVRGRTIAGAVRSGYAEYWSASSASGGGAVPQSWTGLALVLAKTRTISPPSSG